MIRFYFINIHIIVFRIINININNIILPNNNLILSEKISNDLKSKVTFSGIINKTYISSSSLRIKSINELSNVKAKHLKITYDANNDLIIYDRHLSDGQGETFYGLQMAKYLMKDKNFSEITNNLLIEYDNIEYKKSKYNSSNYLIECEICKNKFIFEVENKKINSEKILFGLRLFLFNFLIFSFIFFFKVDFCGTSISSSFMLKLCIQSLPKL